MRYTNSIKVFHLYTNIVQQTNKTLKIIDLLVSRAKQCVVMESPTRNGLDSGDCHNPFDTKVTISSKASERLE